MKLHKLALKDIETELGKHYTNKTTSTAQYGEYADLVGMAFDRYAQLDVRADAANYENQLLNAEAELAYDDYETILETVELLAQ